MALPAQAEFEDAMYRAQRFMSVRGHAREAGLPEEDYEAYEFNIKIDLSEVSIPKGVKDETVQAAVQEYFQESVAEAKSIWTWIDEVYQVGRSGGWALTSIKPPGFSQWVPEYHDETLEIDHRNLLWMMIRHRVDDLEDIQEFISDQQKTLKQKLPELLRKKK